MSEYQYFEFKAIDTPLTSKQKAELREISTRAKITDTGFSNHYDWGDLKASQTKMLEKYFDAYIHFANYGVYELGFRIPKNLLNIKEIKQYSSKNGPLEIYEVKDFVLVVFDQSIEDFDDYENGTGWLSSLISIRKDIIEGDYRSLFLEWLLDKDMDALKRNGIKVQIPPNLGKLSASLKSLVDYLHFDSELLKFCQKNSESLEVSSLDEEKLQSWIQNLDPEFKNKIIYSFLEDQNPRLKIELLQKFKKEAKNKPRKVSTKKQVAKKR